MTISTIRRATDDDYAAIEFSAKRFCARHNLTRDHESQSWEKCVSMATDPRDSRDFQAQRLKHLWTICYCRALGQPYNACLTVGYGHVGIYVQ